MADLSFQYSPMFLWLCAMAAALAAWLLYRGTRSFGKQRNILLGLIRFTLLFAVFALFLDPVLRQSEKVEQKPLLLWLEDHSSSMVLGGDSAALRKAYANDFPEVLKELEDRYTIRQYDFGNELSNPGDSVNFTRTDIAGAIRESKERFYNENIGATVIVSDGIFNAGSDPSYEVLSSSHPIFTVGTGDTTAAEDLRVTRPLLNSRTYLNNEFAVEFQVEANLLNGKQTYLKIVSERGEEVFGKTIQINGSRFSERISTFIPANELGIRRYSVRLEPVEGELNTTNNRVGFSIEVTNDRKKVAVMAASPHPDLSAIKSALDKLDRYELELYIGKWPSDFSEVDLMIVHRPFKGLLEEIAARDIPVWFIYGLGSQYSAFEKYTNITPGSDDSFEGVSGELNESFGLFEVDPADGLLSGMPPLSIPFGKIQSRNGNIGKHVLFHKRIGNIVTRDPIWFFRENNGRREAFIMGTGIWKWRIHNYRKEEEHSVFDQLVTGTVQYLTGNKDDQRFVVNAGRSFETREAINFTARLYNAAGELINEPAVELEVRDSDGQKFDFTFAQSGKAYRLNLGRLPEGSYSWSASTKTGDEKFSRQGVFEVLKLEVEQSDLVARHDVMRKMAAESGGQFFNLNQIDELSRRLNENDEAKTVVSLETTSSSLLNKRWIFYILLALMAIEWGLRKYYGKY